MNLSEVYIQQMLAVQPQLHAYILALVLDASAADDVLQNTNLALCRKSDKFAEGTCFRSWAFSIAKIECFAYWRTRSRERFAAHDQMLDAIADQAQASIAETDELRQALRDCLSKLEPRQRQMLESRYEPGGSLKQVASIVGRPAASVSQTLYRIRQGLLNCVQAKLSQVEAVSR